MTLVNATQVARASAGHAEVDLCTVVTSYRRLGGQACKPWRKRTWWSSASERCHRRPGDLAAPSPEGNTGYTQTVAKVMISMPDELLNQLDKQADRLGQTRSGLLQRLVEREMTYRNAARQSEVDELLALAAPAGGNSVDHLRADRARR